MRYILTGVETNNKGAELMLYAILQQIEKHDSQAVVYMRMHSVRQGLDYIKTSVELREKPYKRFVELASKLHIPGIFYRLGLSTVCFTDARPINNIDYVIDASGFWFTDQWKLADVERDMWVQMLNEYFKQGSIIVFLPQAFGPIELPNTKAIIESINTCADVIMPREHVSYDYMKKAGVDENKMYLFPDFTSLVDGIIPQKYVSLKGGVCIIPNYRMIDKGVVSLEDYMYIIQSIINKTKESGRVVYMLNHEGDSDTKILDLTKERLGDSIEYVDGLNGLEVKGLISTAYLCVSSRYHGVVSALNSCVPCLATSWSHKYEQLFMDFGQQNCILHMDDIKTIHSRIDFFLNEKNNTALREEISMYIPWIRRKNEEMWDLIWNYKKNY